MNRLSLQTQAVLALLTERVDARRQTLSVRLDPKRKTAYGQFMTPHPVAQFMASLFQPRQFDEIRLLDAGAGVGSLTAAFVDEFCRREAPPRHIAVTAYEIDPLLAAALQDTFEDCALLCRQAGIDFTPTLRQCDFIQDAAAPLFMQLEPEACFTHAILNPPYKKIHSASGHRQQLRSLGIETSNLYTGFLAVAIHLLAPGGELVAITPRSFCNGPYFKPFRQLLLSRMALQQIHLFESRTHAFKDDEVLQENIVFHAVKGTAQGPVTISLSEGVARETGAQPHLAQVSRRRVPFAQIVHPSDPEQFIHIAPNGDDQLLNDQMRALPCTLDDLGIGVSTGPVVDFRLKEYLRDDPQPDTVPLIYPAHCKDGFVVWPLAQSRKPNAILDSEPVQKWLYPNGHYTLVRRFSSKEERRRVVAAVHDPADVPGAQIGFENHVNVFHRHRHGLTPELARGLALYLNSTFYDLCFRQFNGHTQVNVKDLYNLRYPDLSTLEAWGRRVEHHTFPSQDEIDTWIGEYLA